MIAAAVFATAAVFACKGNGQKQAAETVVWKTLEYSSYSIEYPETMELSSAGTMGTSFALFFALDSPEDRFRENINLIIQDLAGLGMDLDKYVEISEGQVATMLTDGRMIENRRFEKDGAGFQKMIYTGTQGVLSLKFEQYYTIRNEKAYILTFTAEADQFDKYKDTAEEVMNTFKVL